MKQFKLVILILILLLVGCSNSSNSQKSETNSSQLDSSAVALSKVNVQAQASSANANSVAPAEAYPEYFEEISSIVSDLRGLDSKRDVECVLISSDEFSSQLGYLFDEIFPRDEIEARQQVYEMLEIMDSDQDLYTILFDLYSSKIAGVYDYMKTKSFFIITNNETIRSREKVIYAHEYTHALQDQHFDLNALFDPTEDNFDMYLAASALIESDAENIEDRYTIHALGESDPYEFEEQQYSIDPKGFRAWLNAPQFVRDTIMFPYYESATFFSMVDNESTINDAFLKPPVSTEQILHPEKYINGPYYDPPQEVIIPEIGNNLGKSWELLYADVLGEFHTAVYLEEFMGKWSARQASEGWDGDRIEYWKNEDGGRLLAMYSTWDSIDDATEFYNAHCDVIEIRSGGDWDTLLKEETTQRWQGDGLNVYMNRHGKDVLITMADDVTVMEDVVNTFDN